MTHICLVQASDDARRLPILRAFPQLQKEIISVCFISSDQPRAFLPYLYSAFWANRPSLWLFPSQLTWTVTWLYADVWWRFACTLTRLFFLQLGLLCICFFSLCLWLLAKALKRGEVCHGDANSRIYQNFWKKIMVAGGTKAIGR